MPVVLLKRPQIGGVLRPKKKRTLKNMLRMGFLLADDCNHDIDGLFANLSKHKWNKFLGLGR